MKGVSAIILAAGPGKRMKNAPPTGAPPAKTLRDRGAARRKTKAAASVLTGILSDPAGYGRVVRRPDGTVARIVEERDADASLRRILEVNSGTYAFDRAFLARKLPRTTGGNAQRELHLT